MTLFFQLVITLFLAGFAMVFFADCSRRELLWVKLGLLLMVPAVVTVMMSLLVAVWAL